MSVCPTGATLVKNVWTHLWREEVEVQTRPKETLACHLISCAGQGVVTL